MQGKKEYSEKLFTHFQLSDRIPKENFYRRLKKALDLTFIYRQTQWMYGATGNPSIDPVVFFKLCLVGYLENITSDRALIEHCSLRLDILYFLGYDIDEQLPWHSTLSRTRQLYTREMFSSMFNKVFTLCVESGMVSGHTQAIDSALIKANASMDSIEPKIVSEELNDYIDRSVTENFEPLRKAKQDKASEQQKNITASKKELRALQKRNEGFERKKKEQHGNQITFTSYSNKTHYSPTDPDARIATKPGKPRQFDYLCNMSADTAQGVITHIQADYADQKDSRTLQTMVTKTKIRIKRNELELENILADTGYSSGENYNFLEQKNITAYIPTSGTYKPGREGFVYDKKEDHYTCTQEKLLTTNGKIHDNPNGYKSIKYLSKWRDCKSCPIRTQCIGASGKFKKIERTFYQDEYARAHARMQTQRAKRMVKLRHSTIEPIFGSLINYYGLRKIPVKGKEGAHKCMLLAACAYNIRKWMKWEQRHRKTAAAVINLEIEKKKSLTLNFLLAMRLIVRQMIQPALNQN